jgi:hypothetical protein
MHKEGDRCASNDDNVRHTSPQPIQLVIEIGYAGVRQDLGFVVC